MRADTMVIITVAVVLLVVCLAAHRLLVLRGHGTDVVLRELPALPGQGWHHGVLRYREVDLLFFRLSRVRPGPAHVIPRRALSVTDRREPVSAERGVVAGHRTVVRIECEGRSAELALDHGALTAFLSWVESSPPGRTRRGLTR